MAHKISTDLHIDDNLLDMFPGLDRDIEQASVFSNTEEKDKEVLASKSSESGEKHGEKRGVGRPKGNKAPWGRKQGQKQKQEPSVNLTNELIETYKGLKNKNSESESNDDIDAIADSIIARAAAITHKTSHIKTPTLEEISQFSTPSNSSPNSSNSHNNPTNPTNPTLNPSSMHIDGVKSVEIPENITTEELIAIQSTYAYDPEKWAYDFLGFKCDKWQQRAFREFIEHRFVAWSAGSGVGKTASLAVLVLFFLNSRPFPRVPCTAPSKHQLYNVLWSEISKWLNKSSILSRHIIWQKQRVYLKGLEERWFAVATTGRASSKEKTSAIEGLQGFHEENVLFLVDEASGVADQAMVAIEGSLTTSGAHAILASNPTRITGFFHKIITDPKVQKYWKVIFINAEEARHADKDEIKRVRDIYGRHSDYYRVKVLGLPPQASAHALCTPEQIYAAHERPPHDESELSELALESGNNYSGYISMGVDPARFGADPSVIYIASGLTVLKRFEVRKFDVTEVSRLCETLIDQFAPQDVYIDVIGIGSGVADNLNKMTRDRKLTTRVHGVNVGAAPTKQAKEKFLNIRAELFWNLQTFIDEVSIPIETDLLDEELALIEYGWTLNDKKIKIESKEQIKSKLDRSCNDADAFVLCFYKHLVSHIPSARLTPKLAEMGASKNAVTAPPNNINPWLPGLASKTSIEVVVPFMPRSTEGGRKVDRSSGGRLFGVGASSFLQGKIGRSRFSHFSNS